MKLRDHDAVFAHDVYHNPRTHVFPQMIPFHMLRVGASLQTFRNRMNPTSQSLRMLQAEVLLNLRLMACRTIPWCVCASQCVCVAFITR